jgi:hypothetical protein
VSIAKRFWLWVFEFRIRQVRDKAKIEFLAKELLKEVEAQGYSLYSTNAIYGLDINIFTGRNDLHVSNMSSGWDIKCGTYAPKKNKADLLLEEAV